MELNTPLGEWRGASENFGTPRENPYPAVSPRFGRGQEAA